MLLGTYNNIYVARFVPAPRAPAAVDKGFLVGRQVVMHDVAHLGYVQPACGEVCGHEHVAAAAAELVERALAPVLLHAAVISLGGKLFSDQVLADTLHALAIAHEHHCRFAAQGREQPGKGFEFVLLRRGYGLYFQPFLPRFCLTEKIYSAHAGAVCHGAAAYELRNALHVGGGGEHQPLQGGQSGHGSLHLVEKTKFEALVELVHHERGDSSSRKVFLVQMVVEPAGRGEYHVRLHGREPAVLLHSRAAAVEAERAHAALHARQHVVALQRQFARGHNHNGLQRFAIFVNVAAERQQVCQSFARPRGREQHVASRFVKRVARLLLHRAQRGNA